MTSRLAHKYPELLKDRKLYNGDTLVMTRAGAGDSAIYFVECYDKTDISRWHKEFSDREAANIEYNRWS